MILDLYNRKRRCTLAILTILFTAVHSRDYQGPNVTTKKVDDVRPEFGVRGVRTEEDRIDGVAPRKVGGRPASSGEYPSFGRSASSSLCGGTLIHPDIFLTAAHCEGAFTGGIYVGGITPDGSDGEYLAIDFEYPHPDFDHGTMENDIMLVKLKQPSRATLQELNFNDIVPTPGSTLTGVGVGLADEGGAMASKILAVEMKTLNHNDCSEYWLASDGFDIDGKTLICAGDVEGGKDTCQRDSVGPLYAPDGSQVGITAFGIGCSRPNSYPMYTRVSAYEDFITVLINDLSNIGLDYSEAK